MIYFQLNFYWLTYFLLLFLMAQRCIIFISTSKLSAILGQIKYQLKEKFNENTFGSAQIMSQLFQKPNADASLICKELVLLD